MRVLIFLAGVWTGAIIVSAIHSPHPQVTCCCVGSGSGPAPATSVDIDTRGNIGGSGGARSTGSAEGILGCGCQDSGRPTAGQSYQPVYGHVTIKLKPTPSSSSAHEPR